MTGPAKDLNWNLLHTFKVIAEQRSLSRAGAVLGRGQPAVSTALRRLEEQLGCRLAVRGPTSFELTDAGQVVYREACEVAGSIDRLTTLISDVSEELTGTVNLAIASHMTSPLIDRTFAEFHRRHPKVTFSTTVMPNTDIVSAISNRLIHFGIAPVHRPLDEFSYLHIFKEHCGFYCGPPHQLFGRRGLTLADLHGESAVTYYSVMGSNALQTIADMQVEAQLTNPMTGVSNHMEEVRRLIIAGVGIGAIPIHIAERDVRDGLLWRLPPYEPTMPVDVHLITNPRVRPSRAEQAFIEVLKELVSATPLAQRTYPLGIT
ncbi:MAG: LysR family transcriptional regulator [Alphaproteobacteria bacterium]|nr:LysR family transcriptional regulator [Alphaproteobacteria bacterium]